MLSCYEQAGATYPFGSKKIKCETALNCNGLNSVKTEFSNFLLLAFSPYAGIIRIRYYGYDLSPFGWAPL